MAMTAILETMRHMAQAEVDEATKKEIDAALSDSNVISAEEASQILVEIPTEK